MGDRPRRDKSFFSLIKKILSGLGSVLLNEAMPLDELLNILRPMVYVFLVHKTSYQKKKSNVAIKVSFIIELV